MINFNQYGAKPGVARQAGLLQQQMESNPVQPYVPFSQQSYMPFSQQSGLTQKMNPKYPKLGMLGRLMEYQENQPQQGNK